MTNILVEEEGRGLFLRYVTMDPFHRPIFLIGVWIGKSMRYTPLTKQWFQMIDSHNKKNKKNYEQIAISDS